MGNKVHFSKEMGISRSDLIRALPSIFGQQSFEIKNDVIVSNHNQACIKIKITNEGTRNLASMKVPRLKLEFIFKNYEKDNIDLFMERFLLYLHKGGG